MERFCRFLEDVYYKNKIVWKANEEYLIAYEDEKGFYFGDPIESGIEKEYLNKKFIVVNR